MYFIYVCVRLKHTNRYIYLYTCMCVYGACVHTPPIHMDACLDTLICVLCIGAHHFGIGARTRGCIYTRPDLGGIVPCSDGAREPVRM